MLPFRRNLAAVARTLCALLAASLCALALAAPPPLQILYDTRPPFVSVEGNQLQGSIGKVAQTALKRAGIVYELREIPIRRQLLMIQQNLAPTCAVARIKSEERTHIGVFSALIAESPPYVAIVRHSDVLPEPASLQKWVGDSRLRWGVMAGLHYSDYVQRKILESQGAVVGFHAKHQHFASLLTANRIDFFIVQQDEAHEMVQHTANATNPALRIVPLTDLVRGEQRYFYCSKSVSEATMQALNKALLVKP